ncbi:MAG: hemin uptake protein HemP [Methylophilaceae bacterium]|jgi:hemin uptake protein HemP
MNIPLLKELNTQEMIGDAKMIFILHLGQRYLLSVTKQQKLLLTKVKHDF